MEEVWKGNDDKARGLIGKVNKGSSSSNTGIHESNINGNAKKDQNLVVPEKAGKHNTKLESKAKCVQSIPEVVKSSLKLPINTIADIEALQNTAIVDYLNNLKQQSRSSSDFSHKAFDELSRLLSISGSHTLSLLASEAGKILKIEIDRKSGLKKSCTPSSENDAINDKSKKDGESSIRQPMPIKDDAGEILEKYADTMNDDKDLTNHDKMEIDTLRTIEELEKSMSMPDKENYRLLKTYANTKGGPTGKIKGKKKPINYSPTPDGKVMNVLRIKDLRNPYEVIYCTAFDTDFAAAVKDIIKSPIIGLDAEYRTGKIGNDKYNLPSYVQISTPDNGYVFNIEMLAASNIKTIHALCEICSTEKIKKVGHSVVEDIERVIKYFAIGLKVYKKMRLNSVNIETELFTVRPPQTFGLTDISYRFHGKCMRKKEKVLRTGCLPTIENSTQMEYVALDALMPLDIYFKYHHIMSATVDPGVILGNHNFASKFFVDAGLQVILNLFTSLKIDAIFLTDVTHAQIYDLCTRFPDRILITHDKYLLLTDRVSNKIPYYSNEQLLSQIKKLNIDVFSSDED